MEVAASDPKPKPSSMNKFVGSIFSRRNSRKSLLPGASSHSSTSGSTSQQSAVSSLRKTSFQLVAQTNLRLGDVQNVTKFKMEATGVFGRQLECRIVPKYTHSLEYASFLTLKAKGLLSTAYGNWVRYWARVKGDKIKFWKYPEDVDEKSPEGVIRSVFFYFSTEPRVHSETLDQGQFKPRKPTFRIINCYSTIHLNW